MRKPTLHLNGTSRNALAEGYQAALDALNAAVSALEATAPNGRDYYPQGDGALTEASREHLDRITALNKVRAEIYELSNHCDGEP